MLMRKRDGAQVLAAKSAAHSLQMRRRLSLSPAFLLQPKIQCFVDRFSARFARCAHEPSVAVAHVNHPFETPCLSAQHESQIYREIVRAKFK